MAPVINMLDQWGAETPFALPEVNVLAVSLTNAEGNIYVMHASCKIPTRLDYYCKLVKYMQVRVITILCQSINSVVSVIAIVVIQLLSAIYMYMYTHMHMLHMYHEVI